MKYALGLSVALALVAMPAFAIDTPHVAGIAGNWDGNAYPMTEVETGVWEYIFTGLDEGRQQYKITDGTWDNSLPGGSNSWVYVGADGNLTLTYNANEVLDGWAPSIDRFGQSTDSPTGWIAAGSFQSFYGGDDWDVGNTATEMTSMGGGIYMFEAAGLAEGEYDWKACVKDGNWDSISWNERSFNTQNMAFTISAENPTAELYVDALTGTVKVVYTPEPAGLVLLALGGLLIRRR